MKYVYVLLLTVSAAFIVTGVVNHSPNHTGSAGYMIIAAALAVLAHTWKSRSKQADVRRQK